MRRVVITGIGIVSSIGNNKEEVLTSLREGRSGIEFAPMYKEVGLASQIHGSLKIDVENVIDRKILRFMGQGAAYGYLAMEQAIADSGLKPDEVSNEKTGLVVGSGGPSTANVVEAVDTLRSKGIRRVLPYMVPRTMSSTLSATLATPFAIKGVNYSMTSACATSAHCIGHGAELIQMGKQDVVFAGGGEELHWSLTMMFDAMKALSTRNDEPQRASRPFDADRDGFVISGGGGIVVLEDYEKAKARGATIYAELVGYGATSDGYDMVAPSGEGAVRCMRQVLRQSPGQIDYVNAHGTSTPVGDAAELRALREIFGGELPYVTSTKSLTGHALGAAGVHEAIYSLLMMKHGFISASANFENPAEEAKEVPVVARRLDNVQLRRVMSNSFGFGGTNATLLFEKLS